MNSCLVVEDSRLARKEILALLKDIGAFDEILEAQNAVEAKEILEQSDPQVLFLDIHLPGMDGFEFLESLDNIPKVIFTTAYDEYAIKSFEYNAIDYLLKPIKKDRLEKAIQKLNIEPNTNPEPKQLSVDQQIFVKDGDNCWFVKLKEIRLFESMGNYSKVHFEKQKPMIHKSLNYLESVLDPSVFFRANRQQIINLNAVEKITPWFNGKLKLQLKSGEEIEVSRRQSQKIKHLYSI